MKSLISDVVIPAGQVYLSGSLNVPANATGIVLFAHGSGSSRFSSRNRAVAKYLQGRGLATLLTDLLDSREHEIDTTTREFRFNIPLLADRLVRIIDWMDHHYELRSRALPLGLFGASTGAAAALIAAAQRPDRVQAVVSRSGRPDLAGEALALVQAPTMLIVGGLDIEVNELNRLAATRMASEVQRVVIPDASHLFQEAGTLEDVARHAADWFDTHLGPMRLLPKTEQPFTRDTH